MQVFLHIGLHKTATTYLQNQVFPRLSMPFVQAAGPVLRRLGWQQGYLFDPDAVRASLLAGIDPSCEAVLISSEAFTGDPFLAYVNREQALDRLHRAFPDARVLLGVRGQRTLLWSLYKHQLRFGGARPLQEMLDEAGHWGPGWLDPESFLYTPFVASLAERFGSPPHLLVYEHLQHDRDRYLGDLLAFLGAELEGAVSAGRMNEAAVGDREVRARRALNRLALNRGRSQGVLPLPRSIQAGVVRTAGRLARGAPDQLVLDALADRYRPDNLLLDERYGLRLGEHPAVAASWYLDAPT